MLPAFLTAICFACTAISAQQSASLIGPLRANLYRLLVALLILGMVVLLFRRDTPINLAVEFGVAGAIGFGLGGFCMMRTLQRLGSPRALLFVESLTAIFAGFGAWAFLEDALTVPQVLFCGLVISGVLFAGSTWIREDSKTQMAFWSGCLFAIGAAFFQAVSLVISRHAFLSAASDAVLVNTFNAAFLRLGGGLLAAGLMLLVANGLRGRMPALRGLQIHSLIVMGNPLQKQPVFWVFCNALFGPVLGVTCWLWAVSLLNPGLVQSIAAVAPLISIPIARKLENHPLGVRFYIGAPVAILGLTGLVLC